MIHIIIKIDVSDSNDISDGKALILTDRFVCDRKWFKNIFEYMLE